MGPGPARAQNGHRPVERSFALPKLSFRMRNFGCIVGQPEVIQGSPPSVPRDPNWLKLPPELFAVDAVTITNKVTGNRALREGLKNLPRGPFGRGNP
jgi:hypothetical protein